MDKAKVKFLQDVRNDVLNDKKLTGDQMELLSYHYGSGIGTCFGVAAQKQSWDMVIDLMKRLRLLVPYAFSQTPEFRTRPETGNQQVQFHNTVTMAWDGKAFMEMSTDHSLPKLMLLVILDILIAQEGATDDG